MAEVERLTRAGIDAARCIGEQEAELRAAQQIIVRLSNERDQARADLAAAQKTMCDIADNLTWRTDEGLAVRLLRGEGLDNV